ncbi:LysR family transcriptional regulator [Vreelandella songnenensis]|uniref:LysR family transcriptional regulator n=1 Tax=Vreelandella songnenensis TaxID=1176243 RepID=A0A2T0V825_9GAMM|nr:LysR family transcriptional regulator [Halomonas songnenensis]PRY66291.1 LysR family transcriptional regulator [Halomonas songnenensis]
MNPAFKNLSISQLTALVTILEVRNLSHAARRLGTSQSTLSRSLTQFRKALGDPLMVRQGREYVLTERALALVEPMQAVLEQLQSITATPDFLPHECQRRFTMAGSDHVAQYILPSLLEDLASMAPGVSIDFVSWQANRFDWLVSGSVDLITSMVEDAPDDIHGRVIGEDVAVCCMRGDHPLAATKNLTLDQFLGWPHMKISAGGDKDSFVDAYLHHKGLARELRLTVPYYSAAMTALQGSDMLLVLPEHIAQTWTEQANLTWRPLTFLDHRFRYWVAWHRRTHTSQEQQWFRHFVYQHCRGSQFLSPSGLANDA